MAANYYPNTPGCCQIDICPDNTFEYQAIKYYSSHTYTATCGTQLGNSQTVTATATSTLSQADADSQALALAQAQATIALQCYTYIGTATYGGKIYGATSNISQADANAKAAACAATAANCNSGAC